LRLYENKNLEEKKLIDNKKGIDEINDDISIYFNRLFALSVHKGVIDSKIVIVYLYIREKEQIKGTIMDKYLVDIDFNKHEEFIKKNFSEVPGSISHAYAIN
jgi:hypothetical protein